MDGATRACDAFDAFDETVVFLRYFVTAQVADR
jgi:hypothetical protein